MRSRAARPGGLDVMFSVGVSVLIRWRVTVGRW